MAHVKVCTSLRDYPFPIRTHLAKRISERHVSQQDADDMNAWLKTSPDAPDLNEAPEGWYKRLPSCIVLGEGEFVKTIFKTETPRKGSVDLDTWKPAKLGDVPNSEERLAAIEEQLNDIKLALSHMYELVTETDPQKKEKARLALAQLLKTRVRPRPGSR